MTRVVLALPQELASIVALGFANRAEEVFQTAPAQLVAADLTGVDLIVVRSDPGVLNAALVAACDRAGVRIVPYATDTAGHRLAASFGLDPLTTLEADTIVHHTVPQRAAVTNGGVIVVWGPHGAPGRSTLAASLAAECARGNHVTALVDADSYAPALAMMLGLTDDGPGFASACRSAERRALDPAELSRVSQSVSLSDGTCAVLTGINRPGRWPELSAERVTSALDIARGWAETIVVDVAASLEDDNEVMNDLDGPRRNAATIAALRSADHIVAVATADGVGIARFIRAYEELRAIVGATPIHVVINRVRSSALGLDAKGQIRRTLARFSGIEEILFLPHEADIADGAALHSRSITDIAPRSAFAAGIRRLAGTVLARPEAPKKSAPRRVWRRTKINHETTGVSGVPAQLG